MNLEHELKRLRKAVAETTPVAEVLQEVKAVRQDTDEFTRRWFRSSERELLAAEQGGEWRWLEYSFPVKRQHWVLRWNAGRAPTLWKVDKQVKHNPLNPGSEILQLIQEQLPDTERQLLEQVLAEAPDSLRDLVIRLADEQA